ncbi:ion transporter [Mariniblastus fucicola]|uniref:Cyclic nucleotide-gated potassium channel n=1 Tax=Mariniblastus fucicola TaxID=980251 RepID=A0A5B9P591_9BACT|nr:ion transporter [Mariniblastus fucicola]QEG21747.1 Cyclic nucleotide-gated potassium channel [Mariniblastus fucicola]
MPKKDIDKPPVLSPAREKLHQIIFGADTFWGLVFDVVLLIAIVASIIVACLQTVKNIGWSGDDHGPGPFYWPLFYASWGFTVLFTIEYAMRLYCVRRPIRYIRSSWGIIDLLSFLPDYILLYLNASDFGRAFSAIRSLRLLRVFRIFQLGWFQEEADELGSAIWRSRGKIIVFLATVMVIVTVAGTVMYEVEYAWKKEKSEFTSIPEAIYWAIVTMTTVGYGDIVPKSVAGKFVSSLVILLGYSLIIVPTGFVSAEIIETKRRKVLTRSCPSCLTEGHDADAKYCKYCGDAL